MATQRKIAEEAYGGTFPVLANFSDGAVYAGNFYAQGVDYFELLDSPDQNAIWGEDWSNGASTYQCASFNVDLMRAAARHMMRSKSGFGRIINISSVSAIIGNPGQGNYAASKAGMIGMTKSLAREVASRGITANCIAPGFIATPMTDALNEKQVATIKEAIPAQTFGTPDDIAAAAVYLASPEARYVTGITLHVNGGMVMI